MIRASLRNVVRRLGVNRRLSARRNAWAAGGLGDARNVLPPGRAGAVEGSSGVDRDGDAMYVQPQGVTSVFHILALEQWCRAVPGVGKRFDCLSKEV